MRALSRPGLRHASLSEDVTFMLAWLPLVLLGVYAGLLLVNLSGFVHAIYLSADTASAPYLGELYPSAPASAHVILGNIAWFPALFFEVATRWLPAHRQIWELAPYVISVLGVVALAWTAKIVSGRWAAGIIAAALLTGSPALIGWQFGWSIHALSYTVVTVLGAFVVVLVRHEGRIGTTATHIGIVTAVGVVTGVGLASDELVAPAGLAPFALTALVVLPAVSPRATRRLAASAAGVVGIAVVSALIIAHALVVEHISTAPFPITFAGYDQIVPHLRILIQGTALLFSGDFGGLAPSTLSVLKLACAAVVVGATTVAIRMMRTTARHVAHAIRTSERPGDPVRYAFIVFWGCVVALDALAFVLSSVPVDQYSGRYVVSAAYGIVALAVLAAAPGRLRRTAAGSACAIVCLGGVVALARGDVQSNQGNYPDSKVAGALAAFAHRAGLVYGYAGYWDAAALTWEERAAIKVFPVEACASTLCPFPFHQISSFYTPRKATRTFLVSDPTQPLNPGPAAALGPPKSTVHVGRLTVYVYSYDIAGRFG